MTQQQVIAELARAKALFQARTIALILGVKPPEMLPPPPATQPRPGGCVMEQAAIDAALAEPA